MDRSRILGTWIAASGAAAAVLATPAAHAGPSVGSFQVQLVILKSCRFGSDAATAGGSAPSPAISGACTEKTPYSIELGPGDAPGASSRDHPARAGADFAHAPRPADWPQSARDTVTVTVRY